MTSSSLDASLVWRHLVQLHRESHPRGHVLWAAGLNNCYSAALRQMALHVGFLSATYWDDGSLLLLKGRGRERLASATGIDLASFDRCVQFRVEEHLHRALLAFAWRRDAYVDICVARYPLPPRMVCALLRRLAETMALQASFQPRGETLRIFRRPWGSAGECPQLLTFPGAMIYIRHEADAQFCCDLVRRMKVGAVGLDTEWKPERDGSDDDHPTALVQICFKAPELMRRGCVELPTARGAEYVCFLLHVVHHGVPPALTALMGDESVVKSGVEIRGDVAKLKRHYNFDVRSTVELQEEAWRKRRICARGLRALFQATVGQDYPKDRTITMSNWEGAPLSEQQQNYAACDAFAALRIYETLSFDTCASEEPIKVAL